MLVEGRRFTVRQAMGTWRRSKCWSKLSWRRKLIMDSGRCTRRQSKGKRTRRGCWQSWGLTCSRRVFMERLPRLASNEVTVRQSKCSGSWSAHARPSRTPRESRQPARTPRRRERRRTAWRQQYSRRRSASRRRPLRARRRAKARRRPARAARAEAVAGHPARLGREQRLRGAAVRRACHKVAAARASQAALDSARRRRPRSL
jgi:hypothetical protein